MLSRCRESSLAPTVLVSVVKHSCLSLVIVLVTAGALVIEILPSVPRLDRVRVDGSPCVRLGHDGGAAVGRVRVVAVSERRRRNLQEGEEREEGK